MLHERMKEMVSLEIPGPLCMPSHCPPAAEPRQKFFDVVRTRSPDGQACLCQPSDDDFAALDTQSYLILNAIGCAICRDQETESVTMSK